MPTTSRRTEPTEKERECARRFAQWQKSARERKGFSIPDLHRASGYSDSQVRLYDEDGYAGFDTTGRYRRPKPDYVESIAKATGALVNQGLISAGLLLEKEASDVQEQPEIEYVSDDPRERIIYALEGKSPEELMKAEDVLAALFRNRRAAEKRGTIGGRRADEED